jgi:hypothetical protein
VLIAVVALGQLPVGPGVGAAAAVLILRRRGVADAAAAGVLMTLTGTVAGCASRHGQAATSCGRAVAGCALGGKRGRGSR